MGGHVKYFFFLNIGLGEKRKAGFQQTGKVCANSKVKLCKIMVVILFYVILVIDNKNVYF